MIDDQGDDGTCALLPFWRHRFWRRWISGAVVVELDPMLQGIDYYSGTFLFCNSSSSFFGCVHPYCH
jgi:hypothetical protein